MAFYTIHRNYFRSEAVSSVAFLFLEVLTKEKAKEGYLLVYMYYVYILTSEKDKSYYAGITEDFKRRLAEHNNGSAKYTSSKGNFIFVWYCAFIDKQKAYDFEKYLKSGSGFAFRNKHLV